MGDVTEKEKGMKVLRKVVVLASAAMFALCANRSASAAPIENFDETAGSDEIRGDAPWTVEEDGSWRSGRIGVGYSEASVYVDTSVYAVGPAVVSFEMKSSSSDGEGVLSFWTYEDYLSEASLIGLGSYDISGETDWMPVSLVVTDTAELQLFWEYFDDYEISQSLDEGCGWVRNLQVNPFEGEIRDITLDFNMEDWGTFSIQVADGIAIGRLPSYIGVYNGYCFVGWFTEPEGGELVTRSTVVTEDLETLYAHWRLAVPPANDEYDNAEEISGASGSVEGTLVDATIADNDCISN